MLEFIAKIKKELIIGLLSFLLGGAAALTIHYTIKIDDINHAELVCYPIDKNSPIAIGVTVEGKVISVTCNDGVTIPIN